MRKFVVSDLQDDKEMYDIILSYLENISSLEDVSLIINGNLITSLSSEILFDVQERMLGKGPIQIKYLGGDQELMIYQKTEDEFLGNLDTFSANSEGIFYRSFLISHGDIPKKNNFFSKVKDYPFESVRRNLDLIDVNFSSRHFRGVLGRGGFKNSHYFLIKGGTPIHNPYGFFYNAYEHYLVIDGGCKYYLEGDDSYDHVPLVEIEDGKLTVLTFNHQNEILAGFTFDGQLKEMCEDELNQKRVFLGDSFLSSERHVKELRK